MPTVSERFWQKVDRRGPDECWPWLGAHTRTEYGNFVLSGVRSAKKWAPAHRFAYEVLVSPIPEGMQLDHLCRNRGCVNPAHLEVVTNQENTLRGLKSGLQTTCKRGHPWTPENTVRWGQTRGYRRKCRECARLHMKRANAKRARGRCTDCGVEVTPAALRCRSCAASARNQTRERAS